MTLCPVSAILSVLNPVLIGTGFFLTMNKKILFIVLLVIPFLFSGRGLTEGESVKNNSILLKVETRQLDGKARILANYLSSYHSPLEAHAQDFIDAAKTYNLDWKMLPAIAGVESTFGKFIPGGYNAWGWGVYGTQAIYFRSWKDAIFTIAKGLRENYLNKGLIEPYAINRVYAASPRWGGNVSYFMKDLEKFANDFEINQVQTENMGTTPKIAALSGQLNLR